MKHANMYVRVSVALHEEEITSLKVRRNHKDHWYPKQNTCAIDHAALARETVVLH